MLRTKARLALAVLAFVVPAGARLAHASSDAELISEARKTFTMFEKTDPSMLQFATRAAGYVVFPSIGKGGLIVGGAHGDGVLFINGQPTGKVSMTQVSVGAQIGGQDFAQVIFLETPRAVSDLQAGHMHFAAGVSAVALKSGAAANAKYKDNVAVFTATKSGLMAEASVGGQKFSYTAFAPPR